MGIGVAVLVWYYGHLATGPNGTAGRGALGTRSAVASEMKLPALEAAPPRPPVAALPSADGATRIVGEALAAQGRAAPHTQTREPPDHASTDPGVEPRLRVAAPVLVRSSSAPGASPDVLSAAVRDAGAEMPPSADRGQGAAALGDALQPTIVKAAEARAVASRRWLLPKGSCLDLSLIHI